ncbi:hypothetical protein [Amycolatopsis echigonensis]|uniref:ParB-like nuclease family protein n=1 Tax=Amycolatopsis echigonensis TaxID=2576905 RepID=A0A8E1W3M3_9PSEU|nr:hypothetical protein [Amycolatopsis echigonensis]MBB2503332.1 hypothetical protein [Amycolatopsis echigonensis]
MGDSFGSAWWQGYATRLRRIAAARPRDPLALMPLDETLAALGRTAETYEGLRPVPVDGVVGSLARADDFDRLFRPRNRALRDRWRAIADAVGELPPVRLVRLGDMYFVEDGHHRIALARARGAETVLAEVRSVCTVAWAMRCLTLADLPSKRAERMFLERVPLADADRTDLWLDDPADWFRLADSAEAWGFRQTLRGRVLRDRAELARAWWHEEVRPVVERMRNREMGAAPREIAVYVSYGLDHV